MHFFHQFFTRQRGWVDHWCAKVQVFDHCLNVGVHWQCAKVAQRFHLANNVVGGCVQHQAQEGHASSAGKAANDAEVEQRSLAVFHHEQVAAVQVSVEYAINHCAFHEGNHAGANYLLRVDACVLHADDVVKLEAAQSLHNQHSARHQLWVRARNDVSGLTQLVQHLGNVQHVVGFNSEIKFFNNGFGKQLHKCWRVCKRAYFDAANEVRCKPRHYSQVLAHHFGNRWALHLNHHVFAGDQCCNVYLRNGCCGKWGGVDVREHIGKPRAQITFNNLLHFVERNWWHLVATQFEFVYQLGREQALAAADDLPKLDVGTSQALDGLAHAQRNVCIACLGSSELVALLFDKPRQQRNAQHPDNGD